MKLLIWQKKTGLNLLLLKVDFAKAFDRVNWDFLLDIMSQMGFGRVGFLGLEVVYCRSRFQFCLMVHQRGNFIWKRALDKTTHFHSFYS